jgi:FkbM family methyltransferase
MVVKKYYLKEIMSLDEIKEKEGQFFDDSAYNLLIDHDADVYRIDKDGNSKILFYYRRQIIPDKYLKNAIKVFKKDVIKGSSIRGKAGGTINPEMISKNVVDVVSPDRFKSRVIYKNGEVSKYYVSNKVNSLIAGYFDKPKLSEKSNVLKKNLVPCRMTAFSEKNFDQWMTVMPLIKMVDELYSSLASSQYNEQKKLAEKTPEYVIQNTVFSTVTVNYNWRTACHVDNGDFRDGLSVIIVAEEGDYEGGCLGYPQYGVCVDLRNGDFLLKDPHQYHCNTEIVPVTDDYTRLSMVFYYREKIQQCVPVQRGGGIPLKKMSPYVVKEVLLKNFPQHPLCLLIRPETTDEKVIDEVLIKDVYEKKKLNFYIEPGDQWLDLGGNIGTFAVMCLLKGASVISYEPEEENYQMLVANLEINFDDNHKYTVIKKAVGIEDGTVDFYLCKGDYNKYRHTIYKKRGRTSITVPIESIWTVLSKFPKVNAIKMDIEGAEIDILEQMSLTDWMQSHVNKLVFEYSFDIDSYIPRFLNIIKKLRTYFDIVEYSKVKETEEHYKYFPAMTMVYCLKV